ncbi:MAG: acyl--CoA ligase [Nocardioidaceae bacterium]|nr:acyl--CoA ligase [Nocardioidaceae bacterium]NUS49782.1 acyl--CoA ligase [Nocardioidaceae bacterium]
MQALGYVATHVRAGTELLLAARSRLDDALAADLLADGLHLATPEGTRRPDPAHVRASARGRVWLLTSGTTGRPKRVAHTVASLTTVSGRLPAATWLCPYAPGSYAWWQLVTLGLAHPGQDLVLLDPAELDDWPDPALEHGVTAVSGTPTFWRRTLLRGADLARLPLRQLTLGGEPVDQSILDQLRAVFPDARISWIYASSELGASIVVHDGRAGFPTAWLDRREPGRPTIGVVDDELVMSSPYHAVGLGGPVRTGDRVVVRDDRVHVVGRTSSDEINVGGAKVSAGEVRGVLQEHPAVRWAKVTGRRAPLVGTVVVADLVLAPGHGAADEEAITAWCRTRLRDEAVPRRLRFLDTIPATDSLKSDVG